MPDLYPTFELPDEELEELGIEAEVEYGDSFYFDWKLGDFQLSGGQLLERGAHEAWLDWCVKAVRTQRFAHLVYSDDYGTDLEDALSSGSRELVETELEDAIADALETDPRTARAYGFEFTWEGDSLEISLTVEPTIGTAERVQIRHEGLV